MRWSRQGKKIVLVIIIIQKSLDQLVLISSVSVLTSKLFATNRLQLQGELAASGQTKKVYTGILQALGLIYKAEGVRGCQKGLGCAVSEYSVFFFFLVFFWFFFGFFSLATKL